VVARLLHRRISRIAACLAALMLTLPAPLPPACGCGLANVAGKHSEQTHAEKSNPARKVCCDSHGTTISKSVCCRLRDNGQPCCCGSVPPGRASAQCNCGPSCSCRQDHQVPDPPAGPVNQSSTAGEQVSAAQAGVSAIPLPAQADVGGSRMERVQDRIGGPATSLERCILLSCFTL
jgi:hypothetical protein